MYRVIVMEHKGVDEVATRIRTEADMERVPRSRILIDEDGIGGGVVDLLKGCKGFIANASPIDQEEQDNFKNLKSQCSYRLADEVSARRISVSAEMGERHKEMLVEELEQIRSKDADKDGKRQVMPKDDVKERIGRSPDFSDMMMMRMYFEIEKPKTIHIATTWKPSFT